jgi:hypothetical protein
LLPVVALSLLIGFTFGRGVILPNINPRTQLGAAFESAQISEGSIVPPTEQSENTLPMAALESQGGAIAEEAGQNDITPTPLPLPESLLRTEDLDLSITDRETAIAQLNEEVTRVKNDSVALVSLFNTNCGNWKDECAAPYAATLEINNNTYNDLVQKVTTLQRELNQFRAEKIARQ